MWVPFLRPFPGNEAHKLFSGGPKWGVSGGGQKVYVEKVYVLFRSLIDGRNRAIVSGKKIINSVHTRCIVKTSGFTRGICKNQGFY